MAKASIDVGIVIAPEVRTYLRKMTRREALAAIDTVWDQRLRAVRIVLKGRN